jgi:hypothetical protein
MDTEKASLDATRPENDSAPKKDSGEIGKSENRVDRDPSYMRSRNIALKKFTPQEGEPR